MKYSSANSYRDSHMSEQHSNFYERFYYMGDTYDTRLWKMEEWILDKIIDKYFGSSIPINYLDFACGTGRVCAYLEEKVENSLGIDISRKMLEIARGKVKKTQLVEGDMTKKNILAEKKFNLVTSFRFFLNAESELRDDALKSIYPVLIQDGILVFNIHGNINSVRHIPLFLKKIKNGYWTKSELSIKDIECFLKKQNFHIVEVHGISFMPKSFSKILPLSVWIFLEKMFYKLKIVNNYCIDLVIVAKKDGK